MRPCRPVALERGSVVAQAFWLEEKRVEGGRLVIEAEPDFELMTPARLALFCFRYRPPGVAVGALDRLNRRLLERLNDDGRVYLTQTILGGDYVIRVSIGQTTTDRDHLCRAWEVIRETARSLDV